MLAKIWGLKPQGVLHVGAHKAEELRSYEEQGWGHVYWIEANPKLYTDLQNKLDPRQNTIYNCAAWDVNGEELIFHETSDTQSSSLLTLKNHSLHYPGIKTALEYTVITRTVNAIFRTSPPFSFANLDVQGAELHVLRGMSNHLPHMKAIYTEVNNEELYEGCAQISDIDNFLSEFGYRRVATRWIIGKGWGDALYINSRNMPENRSSRGVNQIMSLTFYGRQYVSIILNKLKLAPIIKKIMKYFD